MSNYMGIARHPVTWKVEQAEFVDDFYGRHHYGVRFADGVIVSERICKEIRAPFTSELIKWRAIVREEVNYEVEVWAATEADAEAAAIQEVIDAEDLNKLFLSVEERDVVQIERLKEGK